MANNFLAFADAGGANVVSQVDYAAYANLTTGFPSGIAESDLCNKVWRQSSVIAYVIGQFIADLTGLDALDNGDTATLLARFKLAVQAQGAIPAARIVTASTNLNVALSDFAIGFNRTAGVAALNAQLPAGATIGQSFEIQDLKGNFFGNAVTILPPVGDTIMGRANYVMNENFQKSTVRYFGSTLWGVG